ncbi:Hsp20/alpha crystallin family protein [Stieleria sp. JC731]|uniref:Hsp20/alpha crystallin family protein n=1 Tax=Pirellulaceae TaxID=2691357 RepID=UPI001E3905C8|nr:Hsp20/alpha crystallin family protein [Stieleria sp. JC731]MCC9599457.1 Hsp20/alpha crystallin family protein [Stieleria sp. JC731]
MRMVFPKQASSQFLDDLATDMNTLVETFFGETPSGDKRQKSMRVPLDIDETEKAFYITLDVPGVAQDAVEIDVSEDVLTVKGSRGGVQADTPEAVPESATDAVGRQSRKRERPNGEFHRVVRFSIPIDADHVSANLADGVLEISVPKADPNKGKRRIPVAKG